MKSIHGMTNKVLAYSLAAFLAGSLSFVSSVNADDDAVVRTAGNVNYVSGGVGTESIDRLNARHAAVIDRYDRMFDSDFITAFEITFLDHHEQTQRQTAFLNAAPLPSAYIALKK